MGGAVDEDWLQVLYQPEPATNLGHRFLVDISGELCDILTPYLSAGELRTMSLVCRDFSSWMQYAGRPELVLARWSRTQPDIELPPACDMEIPVWQPHGKLGEEPAIATRKAVRMRPNVIRTYINSNGQWCERDLPPGTAVDHNRTKLSADLVLDCQNRVCEHLYEGPFWKRDKAMDEAHPKDWADPQPIKFKVASLSNKQTPPEQFRVRLTVHVYRHGNDTPLTAGLRDPRVLGGGRRDDTQAEQGRRRRARGEPLQAHAARVSCCAHFVRSRPCGVR